MMSILLLVGVVCSVAAPADRASPPLPYSLPWQLRPLTVGTVARVDTSIALYEDGGTPGATIASTQLVSYAVTPSFAPLVRTALVHDTVGDGTALVNPLVGAMYAVKSKNLRGAGFLGATVPVGMGGGIDPDPAAAAAASRGIPARSAMDNALFAVNYFTVVAGAGAGWVSDGTTLQVELTVLQLLHVRGPSSEDPRRTNLTAGLHAGRAFGRWVSVGGELRHQRWLSTPAAVSADPTVRDTTTVALGPRLHFRWDEVWIRPGVSYTVPLDAPLATSRYHIVQVDLPVVF